MKITKFLPIVALIAVLSSCNANSGELVGARKQSELKDFKEANPYGMVYIRPGSFMMGNNTQSALFSEPDNQLMVTVNGFWMDDTEVTNNEYLQFVYWVRDSIAIRMLTADADEDSDSPYLLRRGRDKKLVRVSNYITYQNGEMIRGELYRIDWSKRNKLDWSAPLEDVTSEDGEEATLHDLIYDQESGNLNTQLLHYYYTWINYDEAVKPQNRFDVAKGVYPEGAKVRIDQSWVDPETRVIRDTTIIKPLQSPNDLITSKIINIYPDTMVWARDFQSSNNDPLVQKYFAHVGFANYPVVGITWEQAEAFCHWRTSLFLTSSNIGIQGFRLPTEAEWEYAARGGRRMATYPWGSNYARDKEGCFLANFKPFRGSYSNDNGSVTTKVASYLPNDFGLFDMAGNVAEWTSSTYNPSANTYVQDMNPSLQYKARESDPDVLKRKVIRGGSWKDISYYLQCGTRTYEYQYESRPYIGFRCVRSHIGD